MAKSRELIVGADENGRLMSMNSEGRIVPSNIEGGVTPVAHVLKRAADFIAQMTEQTVRHQEARDQVISRLENWCSPELLDSWAQSIAKLAEADRQIAEGVASVVGAVNSVSQHVILKPAEDSSMSEEDDPRTTEEIFEGTNDLFSLKFHGQ